MQPLGNHFVGLNEAVAQPSVIIIVKDEDNAPKFAMIQESRTDIPGVIYGDSYVETISVVNDVTIKSSRPQSVGAGLTRTTAQILFNTNEEDGRPFNLYSFNKEIFYGAASLDKLIFEIYSINRDKIQANDVRSGCCYGIFRVDSDCSWTESSGEMTLSLIDIIGSSEIIINNGADVDDIIKIYNPWYTATTMPIVFGQVPRFKLLNNFPTMGIKQMSQSVSGSIFSNYDNDDTRIYLEKSVTDASILKQFVRFVGATEVSNYYVRVQLHDKEVVYGFLTYNPANEEIYLDITERNTYYNKVNAYMDTGKGSEQPPDKWLPEGSTYTPGYSTVTFKTTSTVIPNIENLLIGGEGYLRADIHFADPTTLTWDVVKDDVTVKITGTDNDTNVVYHDPWDWTNAGRNWQTTISTYFDKFDGDNQAQFPPGTVIQWGVDWYAGMYFDTTPKQVELWFNDPRTATPGTGVIGDPWSLVNVELVGDVSYISFVCNGGNCTASDDHIYYEKNSRLEKMPASNIVSVSSNASFDGIDNVITVELVQPPLDANIGADSNIIYIDTIYSTYATAYDVMHSVCRQDPILSRYFGPNFTGAFDETKNDLPYIGWVSRADTRVSEILDRMTYQVGATFRWMYGTFSLQRTAIGKDTKHVVVGQTDNFPVCTSFLKQMVPMVTKDIALENSASISIGKTRTISATVVDEATGKEYNREYVAIIADVTYGGWEDPYTRKISPVAVRLESAIDRIYKYEYDLINDRGSALSALQYALTLGHAGGLTSTQKKVTLELTTNGASFSAMDLVMYKDLSGISGIGGATNVVYDNYDATELGTLISHCDAEPQYWTVNDDAPTYPMADGETRDFVLGALGLIDEVTYSFKMKQPSVTIVTRMGQSVQYIGIDDNPGKPPNPPFNPSAPPTTPGIGGKKKGGGLYWPMPPIIEPGEIVIDSLADKSCIVKLDVFDGSIWNTGWTWELVIQSDPDQAAVVFSPATGAFADRAGFYDGYEVRPDPVEITVTTDYQWFGHESLARIEKPIKFILRRTVFYEAYGFTETLEDTFEVKVTRVIPVTSTVYQ